MDIIFFRNKSLSSNVRTSTNSGKDFKNIDEINDQVQKCVHNSDGQYIFFTQENNSFNLINKIPNLGYILGSKKVCFPELINCVIPLSYFNMTSTVNNFAHTCWLLDLDGLYIDKNLLKDGFLDNRFQTIHGALVYWLYSQLYRGAIVRYHPMYAELRPVENIKIPITDQLRFIRYVMGRKWMCWTIFRLATRNLISAIRLIPHAFRLWNEIPSKLQNINWKEWKFHEIAHGSVTVIIPTVDRYSYLFKLLDQLRDQTVKPLEVLVIDQTDQFFRKKINISGLPLKVITMEDAGQCGSRNIALRQVQGDFILFLDDDDEIYPELIEDHLRTLSYFNADASCGVCKEPGNTLTTKFYSTLRLSDVFSTNNSMVRRSAIQKVGLFDMAYDRGQKADGDMGARLHRSGALMILNPDICVLHHRAPSGGLRKHNVRKITYTSSRTYITHFRLPHVTELYFNMKYLTIDQQREYIWLTLLGTFSVHGNLIIKIVKTFWALINLPVNYIVIRRRLFKAKKIYKKFFIPNTNLN